MEDLQSYGDSDVENTGEIGGERAPKRKKNYRASRSHGNRQSQKNLDKKVFHRDMKVYEEAERNEVSFHSFSLIEQMGTKLAVPVVDDSAWTLWDNVSSRAALDRDGIPILYHFPGFFLETYTTQHTKSCLNAGEKIELKRDGYDKSSYVLADGELSGRVQFAHVAITHDHLSPFTSPSLLNDFVPLKEFMIDTEFLSRRINNLLSFIDPTFCDGLERLREIINAYPNVETFADFDPIHMEGRSITFNEKTPLHAEVEDFEPGWRVLISLGSFSEGGYVRIPRLGLRVPFLPGAILVLRGAFLEHEVEVWSGGQRICLEYFTQESLWKYAKVEL